MGCHAWAIRISPSGRFLFASNFGPDANTDNVLVFAVDAATGALTQVPGSPFPTGDNPVRLEVHPSGQFLYVMTTGAISAFRVDQATGALRTVPGSPFPPWAWGIALHRAGEQLLAGRHTRQLAAGRRRDHAPARLVRLREGAGRDASQGHKGSGLVHDAQEDAPEAGRMSGGHPRPAHRAARGLPGGVGLLSGSPSGPLS